MIDRTELRKLAEAATPGPWFVTKGVRDEVLPIAFHASDPSPDHRVAENATYIAAANPETIKALLNEDELDAKDAALKLWERRAKTAEYELAHIWDAGRPPTRFADSIYRVREVLRGERDGELK